MAPWVDFATNNIAGNLFGVNALPPLTNAQHAAAGELLLESIGDHYVAGDGRANENFGLTTVHHVFHEDHNVQLVNLEATILGGHVHRLPTRPRFDRKVKGTGAHDHSSLWRRLDARRQTRYTGATYHFHNLHTLTDRRHLFRRRPDKHPRLPRQHN